MYRFFEQSEFSRELARNLDQYREEAGHAWAFSKSSRRESHHGLLQYPAMMVPPMQKRLLQSIDQIKPGAKRLLDPFMGSGTMLTESLESGHFFVGRDINPLAVLSCQVKSITYSKEFIQDRSLALLDRIKADKGRYLECKFNNYQKWFSNSAMVKLSRIKRGIEKEPNQNTRKLFWLVLAETVRLSSNSRTTTYKLHIRPETELLNDKRNAITTFEQKLKFSVDAVSENSTLSTNHGVIKKSVIPTNSENVDIGWGDSSNPLTLEMIGDVDLIFTSPPYGDNVTTVPYGQFSYLPLQWIPIDDICPTLPNNLLSTTMAIDSSSLGGSKRGAKERAEELMDRSDSFKTVYERLCQREGDYSKRVAAFSYDLVKAFDLISSKLRQTGLMFITIGNRSVGGETIRLDSILSETLCSGDLKLLGEIERDIPRKRMPNRNSISSTMNKEKVLIFRKRS